MISGFQELTVLTLVLSFNVARAADGPAVTPFEAGCTRSRKGFDDEARPVA